LITVAGKEAAHVHPTRGTADVHLISAYAPGHSPSGDKARIGRLIDRMGEGETAPLGDRSRITQSIPAPEGWTTIQTLFIAFMRR